MLLMKEKKILYFDFDGYFELDQVSNMYLIIFLGKEEKKKKRKIRAMKVKHDKKKVQPQLNHLKE
jgi:hypothetical protein